jgi:hypothetical protein
MCQILLILYLYLQIISLWFNSPFFTPTLHLSMSPDYYYFHLLFFFFFFQQRLCSDYTKSAGGLSEAVVKSNAEKMAEYDRLEQQCLKDHREAAEVN